MRGYPSNAFIGESAFAWDFEYRTRPLEIFTVELGARSHHASMVGGAYVVDDFALVFKGLFLAVGYIVLLMSTRYIEEGDYFEGEFYFLLLCSLSTAAPLLATPPMWKVRIVSCVPGSPID